MSLSIIALVLAVLACAAFVVGRRRALAASKNARLHSLPDYYGYYLALATALPALIVLLIWTLVVPTLIDRSVRADLDALAAATGSSTDLLYGTVGNISGALKTFGATEREALFAASPEQAQELLSAKGVLLSTRVDPALLAAADRLVSLETLAMIARGALAAVLAAIGFLYGLRRIAPRFRARNAVERVMLGALWSASTVAILTTLGIVGSVLFESLNFFRDVSPASFFFGTVWDPRFSAAGSESSGQFGLLPLLWGTLFISFIAMLVAVPTGLLSAIYMSEYADRRFRAIAKPLLEVLAGIPTIVYGFFALVTFGPALRDLGAAVGLDISANSVLTAGIVMGLMIIPYVSSLSDDIISAVPRALRDGSYGLGATQSETIKRVVLPAALPGIVGAILLAASRAIGETMIVVLAAGIAANLTLNPAESVTTITVKIVSQLTGDLEFNSPQTLVAFALGLTLFMITLALNIYALHIVRKYREQYE